MVRVLVMREARVAPPAGSDRVRITVSSGSKVASSMMGILTVLLVSPLAKLTVMGVGV